MDAPRSNVTPAGQDPDATVVRPASAGADPDATLVGPAAATPSTQPADSMPIALPTGTMLHEYRIDRVLGQGGFGITYLATDVHLKAAVAIKEYLPAQYAMRVRDSTVRPRRHAWLPTLLQGLDQFLVEARTLATFRHPNIVRVARFFEAHRTAYMVLDYEQGRSLGAWWVDGQKARGGVPLPEPDLLLLLHPLLDGLALVHRSGVLHRDIKPDNLSVRDKDGSLVLLDFGAARPPQGDAVDAPAFLTPGYAPLEQYTGGDQGPWTDLYALAATLYWMVTGRRPAEAPQRLADPGCHIGAEAVGAGRYSSAFLRAIDWALQVQPQDRPQSVAAFRQALFAAHASSLGLQEALADETGPDDAGGPRSAARPARARRGRWHPATWPFAVKMTLALVLAALLPMTLTSLHQYRGSVQALAQAEQRNLEQLAQATAGRLSQLLEDHRRVAAYLALEPAVEAVLLSPDEGNVAALRQRLAAIVSTNPDLHLVTLMDAQGTAVVSTAGEVVGGNFAFRDYYRTAMAGTPNVTSILIGAVAGRAGSYLAHPVRVRDGRVLGVISLRLRAESIGALVDAARTPVREPWLVDADGVVIHHRDAALRFRSLSDLSEAQQAALRADQRFRRDRIDSLGMPALARAVVGARQAGHVDYRSTVSQQREVAGFSPVDGPGWVVMVSETHASFDAPLRRLQQQVMLGLVAVGVIAVALALAFAGSIVRPVRRLIVAAEALKRGDYDAAQVRVTSGDEIGALGRTFNIMIDVLRQRERERILRDADRR